MQITSASSLPRKPAKSVEAYAMDTVQRSILPAPCPVSAIAGATSPTMISGTMNLMNWSKTAVKVFTPLTISEGTNPPIAMPRMIATAILGSRPKFVFFIMR